MTTKKTSIHYASILICRKIGALHMYTCTFNTWDLLELTLLVKSISVLLPGEINVSSLRTQDTRGQFLNVAMIKKNSFFKPCIVFSRRKS